MLINSFRILQKDVAKENDEIEIERKPRRARRDAKRKRIENQSVETVTPEVEIIYLLASKIYNTQLILSGNLINSNSIREFLVTIFYL